MNSSPAAPKPKKSVALSGVTAGNTALCTVGRTGNDLHYRGYDILDFAGEAEFEEVAHLLVHEKLPTAAELAAYKADLKRLRGLPTPLKTALEQIPKGAHHMDVLRTGCSLLGTLEPEAGKHETAGAQHIADRLMACFGSMLLYWYHFSHHGKRIEVETDDGTCASRPLVKSGRTANCSLNFATRNSWAASAANANTCGCAAVAEPEHPHLLEGQDRPVRHGIGPLGLPPDAGRRSEPARANPRWLEPIRARSHW